ncbi:MAG: phosphatidylinositol mannoside acyltransferase [Frankiales bacterium]|nr:phosphatidylinositol mannoside acyltransferase [Frankiales bacterium]
MRLSAGSTARLSDWAFGAAWRLLRATPARPAAWVFDRAADLVTRRNGPAVQQFRRNLARVSAGLDGRSPLPPAELDELVREGVRSYARYWLETFRLPAMSVPSILARASTEHADRLDAALAQGKGVILALPHSGNWEVAGIWLIARGQPFSTVAERLKPESLFDKFVAYREGLGMEVLPLTGGPPPTERLKARLAGGGVICLLADRDLSRRGLEVSFFGEPTRMPAGPALLAAQTGAVLLPVHVHYTDHGWGQWVGEPVELGDGSLRTRLQTGTQALADAFADRIAQYPADWHMLQPLWLADLSPRED